MGQTIQIYLPTGEPTGIRIAEITTRLVQVILVPRLHLGEAIKRPELDRVGCYLLLRENGPEGEPNIYIGETEEMRRRLGQHHQRDDSLPGWDLALAVVSKDGSFTKTHGLLLQFLAYQRVAEIGILRTDQRQRPGEPKAPDALRDDCFDALEQAAFLCSIVGQPVMSHRARRTGSESIFVITTKNGADAKGYPTSGGFLVLKGSRCVNGIRESAGAHVRQARERLLAENVLASEDKVLTFGKDYAFESPSGAASVVIGGNANGWVEWRSADGKTLHDAVRIKDGT